MTREVPPPSDQQQRKFEESPPSSQHETSEPSRQDTGDMKGEFDRPDTGKETTSQEARGAETGERPEAGKPLPEARTKDEGRAGERISQEKPDAPYSDPVEGRDFQYDHLKNPDHIGETDPKTGDICLNEDLRDAPPEVRIPHYEHEKSHQDDVHRGEPNLHSFEREYHARMKQDMAWQDLKKPGQQDKLNDTNHNLLYDENGNTRDKGYVKSELESESWGYEFS